MRVEGASARVGVVIVGVDCDRRRPPHCRLMLDDRSSVTSGDKSIISGILLLRFFIINDIIVEFIHQIILSKVVGVVGAIVIDGFVIASHCIRGE